MSKAGQFADKINKKLNGLHDSTLNEHPFEWSASKKVIGQNSRVFTDVAEQLSNYRYVPKTNIIVKLAIFGVGVPLLILGILLLLHAPAWLWGSLGLIALGFLIAMAIIGSNPSIDDTLVLAAYTAPRGWSFSQINSEEIWDIYSEKFYYFGKGDENQYIGTRIWGYMDSETKPQPFQMFHFHYDTVYHVPVTTTTKVGNTSVTTTTMQKHTTPHDYYGIFVAMPESRVRFRITEVGGRAGLEEDIKLEYEELNKLVDIYCDSQDELAVRQFLSPAVQEIIVELSKEFSEMVLDFYPGFVLVGTSHDFFEKIDGVELDKHASRFKEIIQPAIDCIETFRIFIGQEIKKIQKYNDDY